jgi:hypothetical protein
MTKAHGSKHVHPERKIMTNLASPEVRSPYEERVELIKDTLTTNSALDDDTARSLAIRVLHTLEAIPEKVR